jgi:hypothetical protein
LKICWRPLPEQLPDELVALQGVKQPEHLVLVQLLPRRHVSAEHEAGQLDALVIGQPQFGLGDQEELPPECLLSASLHS